MYKPRDVLVGTATCRGYRGAEAASGKILPVAELAQRSRWLMDLVAGMAVRLLDEHWNEADLDTIAAGIGPDGRKLPTNAYMAMRRLGWTVYPAPGTYLSDRHLRMAEELAGRAIRLALHRRAILDATVATWPADHTKRTSEEWDSLWDAAPEGTSKVEVRNRTRQVAAFLAEHRELPAGLTEIEPAPGVGRTLPLAVCDRQQVRLERTAADTAELCLRLPLVQQPASRQDFSEVRVTFSLPPTVLAEAALSTPSLRVSGERVCLDLPWSLGGLPVAARTGHARGIGFDWGVSRILTGVVVKHMVDQGRQRVLTDGRPLFFDPAGVVSKYHHLRVEREQMAAKIKHYEALLDGRVGRRDLEAKLLVLRAEHEAVSNRMSTLNHEIAWAAARWAVDQAVDLGASVIYIEGLGSLEARKLGRVVNARVCAQVRSQVFFAMRHLAQEHGIAVVEVPARGTSSGCPRCGRDLSHVKSSDNQASGYHWARCRHCGLSCDRDLSAAWRIGARGLASQARANWRKDGSLAISMSSCADAPVSLAKRRARDKRHATINSTPVPRRRRIPSSAGSQGLAEQRPEGQVPKAGSQALCESSASSTKRIIRHRPRGEPLGRGFHRNVYASPVRPYGDWGPGREGTPSLRIA